jgi:D-alanine-D-alanine ligase-like ATP-grasp enzyme
VVIYALKTTPKHYGRRPRNPQGIVVCYRLFVRLEESEMAKQRWVLSLGKISGTRGVIAIGKNIVDAIDKNRFEVVLLGIDKQGQWHVNDASQYLLNADDPAHIALNPSEISVATVPATCRGSLSTQAMRRHWRKSTSFSRSFTARWVKMVPCRDAAYGKPAVCRL